MAPRTVRGWVREANVHAETARLRAETAQLKREAAQLDQEAALIEADTALLSEINDRFGQWMGAAARTKRTLNGRRHMTIPDTVEEFLAALDTHKASKADCEALRSQLIRTMAVLDMPHGEDRLVALRGVLDSLPPKQPS